MFWRVCLFSLLVLSLPAFALPTGMDLSFDAKIAFAGELMPVESVDLSAEPGLGQLISEYGDPVATGQTDFYVFWDPEKRLEDRLADRERLPETTGAWWQARAPAGGGTDIWSGGPGRAESMPEPGTFALFAMGMFAVALLLRRRRA